MERAARLSALIDAAVADAVHHRDEPAADDAEESV